MFNAQSALILHTSNNSISPADVQQILGNASVTFANITSVTPVTTAAKHKAANIVKVTNANVILCSNIKAHTSVYANKVKKSAAKFAENSVQAIEEFTAQSNYFEHTTCYSVTQHKEKTDQFYLYCIYNNAKSAYFINNVAATKQQVAEYLTPSAAKELLQPSSTTLNVTHNLTHDVAVRNIKLSNIVSIKARKQIVTK